MSSKIKTWGFKKDSGELTKASLTTIRGYINMLQENLSKDDVRAVIPLSHGDPSAFPCFRTTSVAEDAVAQAVRSANFNGYSPTVGIPPARTAIAEYLSKDLPEKLSPDDIYLTVGCTQAIEIILTVLARPNANILLPRPGFPYYEARAAFSRLEVRHFDLCPERGWEVDLHEVEALADENTVAIVVINPGNPCGNVYTYDHLKKVAEAARKLGILVIADEVYHHLVYGSNPFVPMGIFGSITPIITLGSISKRWLVPGWRIGWLVTNDPNGILKEYGIVDCIRGFLNISSDPATFIQGALARILGDTKEDFFQETINTLKITSDICYSKIKEIPCIICPSKPEGSMFVMVKLNLSLLDDIKDDVDFCVKLAKEESVLILPGIAVGLKNWLRVTFSIEPSSLEEGFERVKAFCEEKGMNETDEYTQDGTVDLKGRPVLRSKTGRWTATSFIVGYEMTERMAYYGIATNLVLYLTRKLHEGTVTSSNNVTNWVGTVWMTPLLGAYLADAHFGRYWTFVVSSGIYFVGMCLLTLVVSLQALRPPSCGGGVKEVDCEKRASTFQVGIFYCALYIIAIGTGGTKPNISTMGADQFDQFEPKEGAQKLSFFNWWMFSVFFGTLFSNTFLVYLQDEVGWTIGYGLPTLALLVSIVLFLVGTPYYRHKPPAGSPLTKMAQVLVASIRKWKVVVPSDPQDLHELNLAEYKKPGNYIIEHTQSLRVLDKAAVVVPSRENTSWMLCPVTQVEQTKKMIKMVPILLASFIPSTMVAQTHTIFIKQGTTLVRSMGPHFSIPPACLTAFTTIFMLFSIVLYDRFFVPFVRRYTKNPRGITMFQRMGIGLVIHVIMMIIACFVERKRLSVAKDHGIVGKNETVPLSIFILLPQFALVGIADNFLEVAKLEYFYDQAPEGMKSLGTAYFTTTLGVGYFLSSLILSTVAKVTKRNGNKGWILDNLNLSHLDYFYAMYAVLNFLNLLFFLFVTKYVIDSTEAQTSYQAELQTFTDISENSDASDQQKIHDGNVLKQ